MEDKKVKVGLKQGGGPEPGYKWTVEFLTIAEEEARKILARKDQYEHVVDQVRDLARQDDPTHPATIDVRQVEDVYELREKGGPLGRINLRVFFFLCKEKKTIVLLGNYKKEKDGATPPAVVRNMQRRKRKYLNGDYSATD